jgi:hypothetical protein
MFGSSPDGDFPPALRKQAMTIVRKADMQIKEQALAKRLWRRDLASLATSPPMVFWPS